MAMKKFIYILILGAACLVSCDKFLDKTPYDSIGTESNLTTNDAVSLVNAAYQPLQWPKLYNMRIWSTDVVAGESVVGAGGGTDGIETVQLSNFTADPSNGAAVDVWRSNPGILRANLALSVLPGTQMDEDLKSRLMGECYFLRAHYYFILVRFFGDVPMRTKPLFATDELNIARTPKEEVYAQIISDTQEAINRLPYKADYKAVDSGYACIWQCYELPLDMPFLFFSYGPVIQCFVKCRRNLVLELLCRCICECYDKHCLKVASGFQMLNYSVCKNCCLSGSRCRRYGYAA